MKKMIGMILVCMMLIACSSEKEKITVDSKDAKNLKEVLALEGKMKELHSFKLTKTDDAQTLVCDGDEAEEVHRNPNPKEFVVIKDGKDVAYRETQKNVEDIHFINRYYKNGIAYTDYSHLPGVNRSQEEANADDLIINQAVKAIDTTYFEVEKKKQDQQMVYTLTLKDPKEYNKKYPADYDDATCQLVGDYVTQKIVIILNKDGFIESETIEETIRYTSNGVVQERLNKTIYQFYDYNIENQIDFSFI